jgi:glutathione S-transferase
MTDYRLTYFDVDGGRAEPIRIAFHAAGIEFEDNRVAFAEFRNIRENLRFHCVPVLEIDGAAVTQSNGLSRYVGKMAGMYPDDDLQALYCDEALGAVEDVTHALVRTFGLEGDELLSDNRLTVADLKVAGLTSWLGSGMLDHIPTDLVGNLSPDLVSHRQRVESDSRVVAYYASRS